jgi:hypothetical protein
VSQSFIDIGFLLGKAEDHGKKFINDDQSSIMK